ncbi:MULTISPECIES: universal stress protein [Bacillaceae]|uniref:universal stress protein n=1 Tax=Bacillaceae TaxID=186817 RepID=UPI001BDEB934|nr:MULTISPECIES: universal stress protein [Bacillaceae]MDX8359295.1 universal stress protein [Cytobacillus sp. IB215316]
MSITYNKILVAVDGSKEAEWAFKKAVEIAKRNNAGIVLTHIVDTRSFATVETYDRMIAERAEKYATELLGEYQDLANKAGVEEITIDIDFGSPKAHIAKEIAPKHNVDLIICGATGLNAIERFFIGSVSEAITRYAKCDVLIVRTEKDL